MVFCSKDPLTAVWEAGDCEKVKLRHNNEGAVSHLNEAPPFLPAPSDLKATQGLSRSLSPISPSALCLIPPPLPVLDLHPSRLSPRIFSFN